MGLSAWIGLLAANIIAVLYYTAVYPPWKIFKQMLIDNAAAGLYPWGGPAITTMVLRLQWIFDWAPVIFIVIALFWAFVSPSQEHGLDYRRYS